MCSSINEVSLTWLLTEIVTVRHQSSGILPSLTAQVKSKSESRSVPLDEEIFG
jgi:hypothetical protein